jgi:hypothetical protein
MSSVPVMSLVSDVPVPLKLAALGFYLTIGIFPTPKPYLLYNGIMPFLAFSNELFDYDDTFLGELGESRFYALI